MDEMILQSLDKYYHVLRLKGYMPYNDMVKLLVLCFYRDFVFHDYRGVITRDDYLLIERALDCLYGSTCLIPYPDYLKMNKLHLGAVTEMAQRVKTLENTKVLKAMDAISSDSDIIVIAEED